MRISRIAQHTLAAFQLNSLDFEQRYALAWVVSRLAFPQRTRRLEIGRALRFVRGLS